MLYETFKDRSFRFLLALIGERAYLRLRYRQRLGFYPNLNDPMLFTEKLQWLKLNEKSSQLTACADKIEVKKIVADRIGIQYVIPAISILNTPDELDKQAIPEYPVIIKTSHDSGGVIVVKKESDFKPDVIRQQLARKMNINFYYANLEWEYKNIKPRILIEPLLSDSSGNTMLNDYKIHCFNGKALFIQTIFDRMNTVKEDWFDRDWQAQPFWYFSSRRREVPRPACLDQMLEIAEALAVDFTYVRVDLYEINGRVYFGEFTFRPYGGFMKWNDKKWDSYLGDLLQLPLDA